MQHRHFPQIAVIKKVLFAGKGPFRLFVPQRLDGIQKRRLIGRVIAEEDSHETGEAEGEKNGEK